MLAFRVVEQIGGMTVREFQQRCDADELTHWQAYFKLTTPKPTK